MDVEKILKMEVGSVEMLEMILSNRIDHGSEKGGLISVAQFPELVKDILKWHEHQYSKRRYIDVVVKYA